MGTKTHFGGFYRPYKNIFSLSRAKTTLVRIIRMNEVRMLNSHKFRSFHQIVIVDVELE